MIAEFGLKNISTIYEIMNAIDPLSKSNHIPVNANTTYVKYTPKSNMYNILESDCLYLFCSELSNDRKENRLLSIPQPKEAYISSFFSFYPNKNAALQNSSDVYSQWLGYCRDGGAAFEFYFYQDKIDTIFRGNKQKTEIDQFIKKHEDYFNMSIIKGDETNTSEYIKYSIFPFGVQYYDDENFTESIGDNNNRQKNSYIQNITNVIESRNFDKNYIAPYFKHSGFVQESEARIAVIDDLNSKISKCIKYLKNGSGDRIPYIVAKFGNNDQRLSPCLEFNDKGINIFENEENIKNYIEHLPAYKRCDKFPIIIPQGRNQEDVYDIVESIVDKMEKDGAGRFSIICQGHLPITKITLGSTPDREQQRKMMEIFCKGKYWLRHVKICESKIPYNTDNINHS